MKAILVALLLAAVASTAAAPETITAYTAAGNAVTLTTADRANPDAYQVIAADPAAQKEIAAANNKDYTLWTIGPGGIYELWLYGFGTGSLDDDIVADFQTWPYPNIRSVEWYQGG